MDNHIIINIGRQFGSGGRLVANEIGKILNIKVYDNELISKAAEESGFSKELFQKSDEKKSLLRLSSFIGADRFGSTHNYVGDSDLFRIQSSVIQDIASKESGIFIGRCSNYILREMNCLDVFISAPAEERAKRVAERAGIELEEAANLVEKQDKTRSAYYNFFTFGEWGSASDYDLCVDSSILGIEKTAEFIINFGKEAGLIR